MSLGHIGSSANVAAASRGASCADASSNKDICGLAIDGGLMPYNNAWVSANEGVGSFITIKFDGKHNVIGAKFMQRLSKTGQNQKLTLTFSEGSTQKVGLQVYCSPPHCRLIWPLHLKLHFPWSGFHTVHVLHLYCDLSFFCCFFDVFIATIHLDEALDVAYKQYRFTFYGK